MDCQHSLWLIEHGLDGKKIFKCHFCEFQKDAPKLKEAGPLDRDELILLLKFELSKEAERSAAYASFDGCNGAGYDGDMDLGRLADALLDRFKGEDDE